MQTDVALQESAPAPRERITPIQEAEALPQAIFTALFEGRKYIYKRQFLTSKITIFRNRAVRAVKVGNFLYIEQDKFGMDNWSERARSGEHIMHIYNLANDARIAEVVNGKVYRLN